MFGMKKSGPTESDVKKALSTVMDPDLNIDIVTLNFISDIKITGSKVFFKLTLTTPACPVKEKLEQEIKRHAELAKGATEDETLREIVDWMASRQN